MKTYGYIEKLFIEYLQLVNQKEVIKTIDNPIYIVFNGIKMLINSIQYIWSKTQCNEKTYTIATNAYMVYLEYVEQMNKTNITYNLDNNIINDSIIFVFKKIDEQLETSQRPSGNTGETKSSVAFIQKYLDIVNYLLCYQTQYDATNNETSGSQYLQIETIGQMQKISENYLLKYFKTVEYLDNEKVCNIIYYLISIQEKCAMKYTTFLKFQDAVIKKIKKWCEKDITHQKIMNKLFDIFYDEETKHNLLNNIQIMNFVEITKIIALT